MIKNESVLRILIGLFCLFFIEIASASGQPINLGNQLYSEAEVEGSFPTNGVHSDFGCNENNNGCIADRHENDPSDPQYPSQWISDWTMFRVMTNYENNPPPYTNPPSTLAPSDYTVSYGTTYYDANYDDGSGAMMENYDNYCLPIFPIKNNEYSCSFVSLGNKAYFITYDDRPEGMDEICLFSPLNHPPRKDFIKYLDYSNARSEQLNNSVQAYEWKEALSNGGKNDGPLFGYAFNKEASPDAYAPMWYRHPQSFFFSGDIDTANAPIISQNYTSFRVEAPDPSVTWNKVINLRSKGDMPECHLFGH